MSCSIMECRKYELNKDKISEFIDDLINLDDWIPFEVNINHPTLYYDQIQNAKDKSALSNKQYAHVAIRDEYQRNHNYIEETLDWEIELFLNKYPQFKSLYNINEEYEYGVNDIDSKKSINPFSRLLNSLKRMFF
ncbi:hypothetical protein [Methanobrevibacter millerae]|nr:hypothetical protein [Methanobrevibacter millerae]